MTSPFRYFDTVFPVPTTERNSWGSNGFLATMNSYLVAPQRGAFTSNKWAASRGLEQHHVGRNVQRAPLATLLPNPSRPAYERGKYPPKLSAFHRDAVIPDDFLPAIS